MSAPEVTTKGENKEKLLSENVVSDGKMEDLSKMDEGDNSKKMEDSFSEGSDASSSPPRKPEAVDIEALIEDVNNLSSMVVLHSEKVGVLVQKVTKPTVVGGAGGSEVQLGRLEEERVAAAKPPHDAAPSSIKPMSGEQVKKKKVHFAVQSPK